MITEIDPKTIEACLKAARAIGRSHQRGGLSELYTTLAQAALTDLAKVKQLIRERDDLLDALVDMVSQHCAETQMGEQLMDFALSANEYAIHVLMTLGIVERIPGKLIRYRWTEFWKRERWEKHR